MLAAKLMPPVAAALAKAFERKLPGGAPSGSAAPVEAIMLARSQSGAQQPRAHLPAARRSAAKDLMLTVTPIWAVLVLSRVLFYGLERLRYPELIPPVVADAIQGALLWPLVVAGCYLTFRAWRRKGTQRGWWGGSAVRVTGVAFATALVVGAAARPLYAVALVLNLGREAARAWIDTFLTFSPGYLYPWLSNAVEYGVLYLSCVGAAVGFLSFRSLMDERLLRVRVEASAAQERLRALRAQLNPHFLFNALNSMVSLSEPQSGAAQQFITQLSDLLRRTLRASEREEHELSEELAYVESYLRIQQARQPSRVDWRACIDVQCSSALVPSLILLPLVENALTHGLRGGAEVVEVHIVAGCDADELFIQVTNSCGASATVLDANRGLGLRNIRERLAVLHGDKAALEAHRSSLDRFEARIRLPRCEKSVTPISEEKQ